MCELREQKNDLTVKLEAINLKLGKIDNMEERFQEIRDKVINIIENIAKMDYSLKETLIKRLVKRIFIKQDYSLKIEYTFDLL